MSTTPLLSIGSRAMAANQAVLSTISNNIANASTPGYSRQQTLLATAGSQGTGQGFIGRGVDVQTVTRAHNEFLSAEAQRSSSAAAADAARSDQLARLENVFPTGENGVGFASNALLNSFVDVANTPQDGSARQVVIARAEELANRFNHASDQLEELQTGVSQDVQTAVTAVNSLARQMASVNKQIEQVSGSGHTPNDLYDKRDQLITEIGKYIQVTPVPADNGQVSLFVGGGQQLVLGSRPTELQVVSDPYDVKKVQIAVATESSSGVPVTVPSDSLAGGTIAGLLRFQNHDLGDARNLLGQMAVAVAGAVNKQQSLGIDLKVPAGSGAAMFSIGAPEALPASSNARTGNAYTSRVDVAVYDPSQLQASDYSLKSDPDNAGQYLLTRMSDGLTRSIASGAQVDGMTITLPAPAPGGGDKFLIRPVANGAGTLKKVLNDPAGIAAASPVQATLAATNTGTGSVAAVRAVDSTLNPNLRATVTFSSDTGSYDWTLTDTTTNTVAGTGSATWTPGEPISLNGFELDLDGVPKSGDVFTVSRTQGAAANNGNALAMVSLRDRALVGRVPDGSGLTGGETLTNAYSTALADVGVRVQNARSTAATSASVASQAEQAKTSESGVNLDEEAARLIQFQQSYQAAAKVLSVAQAIFDSLLQAARS